MANRPKGFGMTAELANKKAAKFDPDLSQEAIDWLRLVLEDDGRDDLANKLPKSVRLIHQTLKLLLYRNQSIDLQSKSIDCFLYDVNFGV